MCMFAPAHKQPCLAAPPDCSHTHSHANTHTAHAHAHLHIYNTHTHPHAWAHTCSFTNRPSRGNAYKLPGQEHFASARALAAQVQPLSKHEPSCRPLAGVTGAAGICLCQDMPSHTKGMQAIKAYLTPPFVPSKKRHCSVGPRSGIAGALPHAPPLRQHGLGHRVTQTLGF